MRINKLLYIAIIALLTACSNDEEVNEYVDALEIRGISAVIGENALITRSVGKLTDSVGRSKFSTGDQIVFTTIKRTANPLTAFTYSNICYDYRGSNWGRTEGNTPEKIYWTDGASDHTFVGYSLPSKTYHWVDNGNGTYAGELGYDKTELDFIDGNDKIEAEDLLLNYNTETVAETGGLSTKVGFSHALSNIRVVVDIKNYAANASALDTKTMVSDMVVHNQPTKFTWGGNSSSLNVLNYDEQIVKDVRLWCPVPAGVGEGQSKVFTFYGLTTPQDATYHQINGNDKKLEFSFKVTCPDASNTSETITKTYKGTFDKLVDFNSGKCTTLNISLNHKDEQMMIGVEYSDWNYVATPDIGELRKKSTFMDINSTVTIHTDKNATVYDATWLYKDASGNLKDIYGNDGTKENPYRISTASQLLSFAKEVKNGLTFGKKYIRLDADITMQASTAKTSAEDETLTRTPVSWIGIGDTEHVFNGTFLGCDRYINRLYGSPLFVNLGDSACVEQLYISPIGSITDGALATTNAGVVGACKVLEEVTTSSNSDGVLVGTNTGTVYACYHTGTTKLVGSGDVVGCYTASDIISLDEGSLCTLVDGQNGLNSQLDNLYNSKTDITKYKYVYSVGSYPTVVKK